MKGTLSCRAAMNVQGKGGTTSPMGLLEVVHDVQMSLRNTKTTPRYTFRPQKEVVNVPSIVLTTVIGTTTQSLPLGPPSPTTEHVVETMVVTSGGIVVTLPENVALCPIVMTVSNSVSVGIGTHAIHTFGSPALPQLRMYQVPNVERGANSERKRPRRQGVRKLGIVGLRVDHWI